MSRIDNVLYTGKVHITSGGRDGSARSDDGKLDIQLSSPGSRGTGTNPEQLLAAGWSACFIGAMGFAAKDKQVKLPSDTAVDAEVDLGSGSGGYALQARLNVSLPGIDREVAQAIIEQAHKTCPYSKALTGNIDIEIKLAGLTNGDGLPPRAAC